MKFPASYFLTLEKIHALALAVQAEIQRFQPEVLLILARGGFAPLWALQTLWDVTHAANIPPVVVTNLGREKLERYEYHRQAIGVSFMPLFEPFDFLGACERGYFLAWLARQADWRTELHRQVQAGLGHVTPPARILVVDDTVHKRYTALIALGLLLAEYPQAEARMIAGDLPDWRPDLAAPWLGEQRARRSHPSERELMDCVFNLAPGVSDLDPASLGWELLHPTSRTMREYGKFLSAQTWLDLPAWLKEQIQNFVQRSVHQPQAPLPPDQPVKPKRTIHRPLLEPEELLFRRRWLSAGFTPGEAADGLGLSVEDAAALLEKVSKQ